MTGERCQGRDCPKAADVRTGSGTWCLDHKPRSYGQHNPDTVPAMMHVTLGSHPRGKHYATNGPFREFDAPVPKIIQGQIAAINAMAYEAGRVLEVLT